MVRWPGIATEEMMVSIIGAQLVANPDDRDALLLKATFEAVNCGLSLSEAGWLVMELSAKVKEIL